MFNNLTLYTRDYTKPVEVKTKAHCAWQENVEKIMNKVNPSRIKEGYKAYSFATICGQLKRAGVNKSNIYAFIQECEKKENFGKYYSWRVKQKKGDI